MDTVARHGFRWRIRDLPWPDEDGNWWLPAEPEPKWAEADLTPGQQAEIDAEVAQFLEHYPQDDPLWVRWAILERNGIEHTHRRGKPIRPHRPAYGYECSMCKGYIVAEDPGDFLFRGGVADGRWIVTGGIPRFRVPIRQPVTVAVQEAGPFEPSMAVAEYELHDGDYWLCSASTPPSSATPP